MKKQRMLFKYHPVFKKVFKRLKKYSYKNVNYNYKNINKFKIKRYTDRYSLHFTININQCARVNYYFYDDELNVFVRIDLCSRLDSLYMKYFYYTKESYFKIKELISNEKYY